MLRAYTGLLMHQALQLLKFRNHVRSKEVGILQEGILLPRNAQDCSQKPGTETDRPKNQLAGELEPVSPVTEAQHHQHHLWDISSGGAEPISRVLREKRQTLKL